MKNAIRLGLQYLSAGPVIPVALATTVITVLAALPASPCRAGWEIEVIDPASVYSEGDIALDNLGTPKVCYQNNNEIVFAERGGTGWTSTVLAAGYGIPTLDLDSSGAFHSAWDEWTGGSNWNLNYCTDAGGAPVTDVVESGPLHGRVRIDAGSADYLHLMSLGYVITDDGPCLSHWTHDGMGWSMDVAVEQPYFEQYFAAALDNLDYPHTVYCPTAGDHFMYYTWKDGSEWHTERVDNEESLMFNITTCSNRFPHIAYYDENTSELAYIYRDGGGWHRPTVDTGFSSSQPAICIDSLDGVHIVYFDVSTATLTHAHSSGGIWNYDTVDDSFTVDTPVSAVLDTDDHIHVVYDNRTAGTFMYARFEPDTVPTAGATGLILLLSAVTVLMIRRRTA